MEKFETDMTEGLRRVDDTALNVGASISAHSTFNHLSVLCTRIVTDSRKPSAGFQFIAACETFLSALRL